MIITQSSFQGPPDEHQFSIAEVPLSELLAVWTLGDPTGISGPEGVWLSQCGGRRMWSCSSGDLWLTLFGGLITGQEGEPPAVFTGHIFSEMISLARTAPTAAVTIRTDFDPIAYTLEVEIEDTHRSVRVRQSSSDTGFFEPKMRHYRACTEVRCSGLESLVSTALESAIDPDPLFSFGVDGSELTLTEEELGLPVGERFMIRTLLATDAQQMTISLTALQAFLAAVSATALTDEIVNVSFTGQGQPLFLNTENWDLFVPTY